LRHFGFRRGGHFLGGWNISRLLKNSFGRPEVSPAAKAAIDFAVLTARLEAAPLQNGHANRVFQQPVRAHSGGDDAKEVKIPTSPKNREKWGTR
jgi:hypothetical protein